MTTGKRTIEGGEKFDHLFPKPAGKFIYVKRGADTIRDTIPAMFKVIKGTLEDTIKLVKVLKGSSEQRTCQNIWEFVFRHIQYEKDAQNLEQIRRPARAWKDRKTGSDCDCMTVFICSCLENLNIDYTIRISQNDGALDFGHVYPIAHTKEGDFVMDAVVHKFNVQAPYIKKQDFKMDLQYLNGFEDGTSERPEMKRQFTGPIPEDAELLFQIESEFSGLDGKIDRQARREDRKEVRQERKENKPPLKERIVNAAHAVNRINPATVLLRAGVLASLKLNLMNVAAKLRFSYWTEQKAAAANMEPGKHKHLTEIRQKLEKIFFGAGGKPENMREAILTGRGNKDRQVTLSGMGEALSFSNYNDLGSIIGYDIYEDEFAGLDSGVGGLGSVSAAAAIASASGVIGTIAGLLKKLGNLFKKGSPEAEKELIQENTASKDSKLPYSPDEISSYLKMAEGATAPSSANVPATRDETSLAPTSGEDVSERSATADPDDKKGGLWQKIKDNPIPSLAIAAVVVGGIALGIKAYRNSKKSKSAVNGLDGHSKAKRKKPKSRSYNRNSGYGSIPTVELI